MEHASRQKSSDKNTRSRKHRDRYRAVVAAVIATLVVIYVLAVVTGYVPSDRQLSVVEVALVVLAGIAIAVILKPEALKGLELVQFGKLTVRIRQLTNELEAQREDLATIEQVLPLLLTEFERRHLVNLLMQTTAEYKGGRSMRHELRRLRSMGLIEMIGGFWISSITDGKAVDLSDLIRLTKRGEYWARMCDRVEKQSEKAETR